jgi:integrase
MNIKTPGKIINELKPGKFANLGKISPCGSLEARKLAIGVTLYWRVTIDGKTHRESIGLYDSSAAPKSLQPTGKGYSIQAAIRACEILAQKHHANLQNGGYPGLIAAETEAKRIAVENNAKAQQMTDKAELEASKYTLNNLLFLYCDHLETLGRSAHKDARSIFRLHVVEPWPDIASLPANQVTGEQIADMMRRVIERGNNRTANKLRSYVRAAYQVAKASRTKASIPRAFNSFKVITNPASETEPDESANRADKNPLSTEELCSYWKIIKPLPGFIGAVLRLHLLTGGQRIEQLVRLLSSNVNPDFITLFDGKGRPGHPPRLHTVPLIPAAATAMQELNPTSAYAISTDGGKTHLSGITLSHWAKAAATGIKDFQAKRIRSGVETLLASARIQSDHRGRLQSHGIGGVQSRHYDAHDYLDEKRHALDTLFKLLEGKPVKSAKVKSLKASV